MSFLDDAMAFESFHGFPAPPQDAMERLPEWPIPFCHECCDWHVAAEDHSMQ